jgi:Flp pilus assembly protein TadG
MECVVECLLCRFLVRARRLTSTQKGNVAITFALAFVPLVTLGGGALDFAKAINSKAQLQAALDAAVLVGVQQSSNQTSVASNYITGAIAAAALSNASPPSFTLNSDGSLSGTAQAQISTNFLSVIHIPNLPVTATATAKLNQKSNPVCILVLDGSASQALLVNSGANIQAPTCEIDVRSTASPAAMFNSGTTLNVAKICVAGNNVTKNGGSNPPVSTGCAAISDPFAGKMPAVSVGSCTYSNEVYNGSTVTLNPGTYCGSTNFNGSPAITFNSGLYVISGGTMTINSGATLSGTGVTFYLADANSKIQFNGGVSGTLLAPTSGTYANILIFEPNGLGQSQVVFDGTNGENLQGLIYLPSRQVTFNSVSNVSSEQITMVVDTLILDSTNFSFTSSAKVMQGAATASGGPYLTN